MPKRDSIDEFTLMDIIVREMSDIEEDDSHRLIAMYWHASDEQKKTMDEMSVWLTGWTLPILMQWTEEAEADRKRQIAPAKPKPDYWRKDRDERASEVRDAKVEERRQQMIEALEAVEREKQRISGKLEG